MDHFYWNTDRAILDLGVQLPDTPAPAPESEPLDSTLVVTPHEDRANQRF